MQCSLPVQSLLTPSPETTGKALTYTRLQAIHQAVICLLVNILEP